QSHVAAIRLAVHSASGILCIQLLKMTPVAGILHHGYTNTYKPGLEHGILDLPDRGYRCGTALKPPGTLGACGALASHQARTANMAACRTFCFERAAAYLVLAARYHID